MEMNGITFDDVFIDTQYSDIESRSNVDLTSKMRNFELSLPIISANMPNITEWKMAKEMAINGGMGILHRFYPTIEDNVADFHKAVKQIGIATATGSPYIEKKIGVSVGVKDSEKERFDALYEAGARIFCIDVNHGHSKMMKDMIGWIYDRCGYHLERPTIIAGNIATARAALDLSEWGADILKVGIGPGCFVKGTKIKTKNGYKKIENIKSGDVVLTHRGRYKKVTKTTNRKEQKEIYSINNKQCTGNHEFYVVHKQYRNIINDDNIEQYAEWISADKLSKDYLLLKNK